MKIKTKKMTIIKVDDFKGIEKRISNDVLRGVEFNSILEKYKRNGEIKKDANVIQICDGNKILKITPTDDGVRIIKTMDGKIEEHNVYSLFFY